MRSDKTPGREGGLPRWAWWLGFDRNPLRRGTDRIESVIRLTMMILLVVAVPIVTVAVGQRADHLALRGAEAQQAQDHLVNAVLLQAAPATGIPDPYTSVQWAWVPARWQPPGRPARSGVVLAIARAPKGSTVQIWINAFGAVADPPPDHREIVGDVCIAAAVTCLASLLLLLASEALARRALDRRRLRMWEAEWRATEPRWTGHRGGDAASHPD